MKNADMPAIPTEFYAEEKMKGLTKREYFAAMTMQGLIASGKSHRGPKHRAFDAIEHADALLESLEESKQ